jgi:hypothetical protein
MNLSMNYGLAFVNREVGIYVFSPQDTFQKSHIEGFLSYLKHFCRYTIFDDLERIKDFNKQNSILIFFISSIADFRYLEKLSYLNYSLNIVAYFLYSKEFKKVDCKGFRAPIKALSFNIIYPDRYQRGLFYPNNQKIIDTVYYKSETAVAFLAFQEFPSANILLHFHDKRMTYTPQLARYQTSKYVTYGTPGEAKTIVRKLKETSNFAIANGHGEFLIASDLAEARAYVSKIISIIT